MSAHAIHESDEFDLLDIAVALAEWWKAFLIVPLAAAAIGYGIGFAMPVSYTSTLRLPPAKGAIQAPVFRAAFSAPEVRISFDRSSNIIITASAPSAAEAQGAIEVARSLIAGTAAKWAFEERENHTRYLDALLASDDKAFLAALSNISFDMSELHAAEAYAEVVKGSSATTSRKGGSPVKFALIGGIASVIILGLLALISAAIKASIESPNGAAKLARIKTALRVA